MAKGGMIPGLMGATTGLLGGRNAAPGVGGLIGGMGRNNRQLGYKPDGSSSAVNYFQRRMAPPLERGMPAIGLDASPSPGLLENMLLKTGDDSNQVPPIMQRRPLMRTMDQY